MAGLLRRTHLGIICLTFAIPWGVEAQPPTIQWPTTQSAGVSVELEKATAAEAIQALAELLEVDFMMGPLPPEAKPFALEEASPVEALAALGQTYGIEAVLWRGLLVAVRRDKPLLLGQRLQAALPPDVAVLLFRPRDDDYRPAPGFERVLEAIQVLAQGKEDDPAAHEALVQAALWMAAGELPYLLRPIEAVQSGLALLKIEPRATWERWMPKPDEDPCMEHLLLVPPAEGPGGEVLRPLSFHAQGFDRFALQLQQERGLIGLDEYKQRLVKATRERDDPFYQQGALTSPVTLGEVAGSVAEIVRPLAEELGVKIAVEGSTSLPIALNVSNAAGADVLRAIAYCAGLTLLEDKQGSYLLTPPVCPLEQIQNAFPLLLWAAANSTAVERDLLRQQWVDLFFQSCRPEERQMLESRPVRVADLMPLQQAILLELVYCEAGGRFQKWLENLPERNQLPPLWLYESTEKGIYELAAPGVSEQVRGWLYLQLKTQIAGQPWLTSSLWKLPQTDIR